MPVNRTGGVFQDSLADFTQRAIYGDWVHMFPEGCTYQDQLKKSRDSQGRRFRPSGRTAPPGRDLGPMKWGVGKVVFDVVTKGWDPASQFSFQAGVNNNRLIVLPYYHLNMEKVMPQDENNKIISIWPRRGAEVYCIV